ncbi:MbtH protein [Actinopolyspora lacussalsi]|nr:MbtH protein [Actinopolyspora lacussalsi]
MFEARIRYRVVRNQCGQYSIWPADSDPPSGWDAVGEPAAREECLTDIDNRWRDIRPAPSSESCGPARG